MNLSNYEIITKIAELRSFSRCAQELHLTPSAISHTVRKMEQEYGFPLFLRSNTSSEVLPSRECEALLPKLYAVLHAQSGLDDRIFNLQKREAGHITLASFNSFCINELVPLVAIYRQDHPDVTISIMQGGYRDVSEWVSSFKADLGFIATIQEKQFAYTPLMYDEMLCVTSENLHFSHDTFVTREELLQQTIIMQHNEYGVESRRVLENMQLAESSGNSRFENMAYEDDAILAMIEIGMGVSFLPSLSLKREHFHVRTYSLEKKDFRLSNMIRMNTMPLSPAAEEFARFVTRHYASMADGNRLMEYSFR